MDSLYDNLDNYYDEKLMNELKTENKELKVKLEEYSSAMARLQTDFEKLSSEYKKLETNYSSLLKTARSEIERKTEMIKNLNLEKDKLVLDTLQRPARKTLTNRPKDTQNSEENAWNTQDTEAIKEPSYKKDRAKNSINNRNDSEEAVSKLESSAFASEDKRLNKSKSYKKDELSKAKNIRKDEITQSRNSKDEIILNKRKSVPSQIDEVFSSDEVESLDLNNRRFLSARDNTSYRDTHYRNKDHRFTESYNSQYLDSSNKIYRNQKITSSDNDIYKNERYESDTKYRTHHHREKYNYYKKEYYQPRGDCDRQRVLRSPPIDKYKRSKSRDRRVKGQGFEREDYRNYDRQSPNYNENLPMKYNIRNDFDEPSSKRQRTNIHARDIRHGNSTESYSNNPYFSDVSCQILNNDNFNSTEPQHVVQGSKHTATSLVESTEGLSQKCITQKNEVLPIAENINIKYKKSLDVTGELINKINMDKDNSESNLSLESGEILNFVSNENATKTCENFVQKKQNSIPQSNSNKNVDNLLIKHTNSSTNPVYKIPKIKYKDYVSNKNTNLETNITKNVPCNFDIKVNKEKNLIVKLEKCNIGKLQNTLTQKRNVDKKNEEINKFTNSLCSPENIMASINTLAGDLELSDDASDNQDLQDISDTLCNIKTKKKLIKEKESSSSINLNRNPNKLPSPQSQMKDKKSKQINKSVISKKNTDKKSTSSNYTKQKNKKKVEQSDSNCSDKTKKQSQEAHEIIKPSDKGCKRVNLSPTKSKLNEIFGDSSSLITPDDLGIPSPEVQVPLVSKFDSDFDKEQDAIDVKVEILSEIQSDATTACSEISTEKASNNINTNPITITTKENFDNNVTDIKQSSSEFYENAKSETLEDTSNVVKTIVISTGVQPNCLLDKSEFTNSQKDDAGLDDINSGPAIMKKPSLNIIEALVNSTPQKEISDISPLPNELNTTTNAGKVNNEINLSSNISNSSSIILDVVTAKTETDEPDLRIFVKRRRKVIKRV